MYNTQKLKEEEQKKKEEVKKEPAVAKSKLRGGPVTSIPTFPHLRIGFTDINKTPVSYTLATSNLPDPAEKVQRLIKNRQQNFMKINIQNFSYDPLDSLTNSEPVGNQKKRRKTQKKTKSDMLDKVYEEDKVNSHSSMSHSTKTQTKPKDMMKIHVVIDEAPEIQAEKDEIEAQQVEIKQQREAEDQPESLEQPETAPNVIPSDDSQPIESKIEINEEVRIQKVEEIKEEVKQLKKEFNFNMLEDMDGDIMFDDLGSLIIIYTI